MAGCTLHPCGTGFEHVSRGPALSPLPRMRGPLDGEGAGVPLGPGGAGDPGEAHAGRCGNPLSCEVSCMFPPGIGGTFRDGGIARHLFTSGRGRPQAESVPGAERPSPALISDASGLQAAGDPLQSAVCDRPPPACWKPLSTLAAGAARVCGCLLGPGKPASRHSLASSGCLARGDPGLGRRLYRHSCRHGPEGGGWRSDP